MRCIEIKCFLNTSNAFYRLTLTWDVLKYAFGYKNYKYCLRLTLTWDVLKYWGTMKRTWTIQININMRCIEIIAYIFYKHIRQWLTLTWDVLK